MTVESWHTVHIMAQETESYLTFLCPYLYLFSFSCAFGWIYCKSGLSFSVQNESLEQKNTDVVLLSIAITPYLGINCITMSATSEEVLYFKMLHLSVCVGGGFEIQTAPVEQKSLSNATCIHAISFYFCLSFLSLFLHCREIYMKGLNTILVCKCD